MIDAATVLKIVATFAGLWAVGFSAGKFSAYIRAIRNVA